VHSVEDLVGSSDSESPLGRLGVYGLILGRLPLGVFSIGKYAFQKRLGVLGVIMCTGKTSEHQPIVWFTMREP
jgi:hypothetical protein